MNDPKSFLAAIILLVFLAWAFIQGGWRTVGVPLVPLTVLVASLTIMVILRLVGLWMW